MHVVRLLMSVSRKESWVAVTQALALLFLMYSGLESNAYAACGATNLTWYADAGSTAWATNQNWATGTFPPVTHNNFPNASTENAIIQSDWRVPLWPNASYSLGCFSITSGTFTATPTGGVNSRVMTVVGDYFNNPILGSMTTNSSFGISMAGTGTQTFTNRDSIDNLTINNPTSVTFPANFGIKSTGTFTISSGSGALYIDSTFTLNNTGSALVIPASATVEVRSGGTLIALGGITVNGILKISAGGQVLMGNGTTLTVNSGGLLQLAGSASYVATLNGYSGGRFTLNSAGSTSLNYFWIGRTQTAGVNITGTLQALSNGDFHYPPASGYAVTIASGSTIAANWNQVGFYNDSNLGSVKTVNATGYTGTAVTIDNYAGNGGSGTETDPNNKVAWGTMAGISLQVTDATAAGSPASTIAKGSADTLFATFGFSLTGTGTATDITSIKFTIGGSNTSGDVNQIKVYNDTNSNCVYNAGVDTIIGSAMTVAGAPSTATLTIPASTITLTNTTQKCIHVLLSTSATAQTSDTLSVKIASGSDVTNSNGYSFSLAGGPPVNAATSTITGAAIKNWNGGNGTAGAAQNWTTNTADWTPTGTPVSTDDVQIGAGYSYPRPNGNRSLQNLTLPTGGILDFNSTTNIISVSGSLTIGSGYTFLNSASGRLSLNGTGNQAISAATTFPGNLDISKSSGTATLNSSMTIGGALTITSGTLTIASGNTLTVGGNVTMTGGTLIVSPGATLKLSNGRVVTIGATSTLTLIGDTSQTANLTSTGTTSAYSVIVNGTISARYYSVSNLGVAGMTINSGATIDASNYLQNGSFTYPIGTNPVILTLNRQIPGNALSTMAFDLTGSSATGTTAIKTNTTAGTLIVTPYSGNLTNCCTNAPTYTVSWGTPSNTIKLTQEATGPSTVNQGQTYTMGRFGFQQTQAGASFSNADLTTIKITMTGTGTAADVTAVRLYYDSACTGSGGTLLGSSTFSGFPAVSTFSGLTGATVQASATAPPKRCVYVIYDIASGATNSATIGATINASTDVINSQTYEFNGSYSPPVTLGTPATVIGNTTTWNGGTSTSWATAANWTGGLPTSMLNCVINSATNNPVISAAGAVCKSLTIGNGNLTINSTLNLDIYGSLTNTGTLTMTGATLTIRDDGVTPTTQSIQSSTAITASFNKTAGSTVLIGSSNLTLNSLVIPAGQNFTFQVLNGDTLTLPTGATFTSGTFQIDGGGMVLINPSQTVTVNGGTFRIAGTNDIYPQDTSNKGRISVNGTGTWSFNSTSGNLNLVGFLIDWLDTNGFVVGGTTVLQALNGGQLRNLSQSYASVKAFQFNSSGTMPATASNVGWNWGPNNTPPIPSQAYTLAASTGCANHTMSFDQWFGDFFVANNTPDAQTKVSTTNCTINIATSASPVTLVGYRATPYNNLVILNWTTGLEILHKGFNVYRSLLPDTGFTQINSGVIRNPATGGTIHGKYQYLDNNVINGLTYYYMLEDISNTYQRTLHGPFSATPLDSISDIPGAADPSSILAQSGTPAPSASPGLGSDSSSAKEVASGVKILAQSARSMRIQIDIPAPDFTPVPAHGLYKSVSIPEYSVATQAGFPELPERTVLIEIPSRSNVTSQLVSEVGSTLTNILIAPAPSWNGTAIWTLDTGAYSSSTAAPTQGVDLGSIVSIPTAYGEKHYIPLQIHPITFTPSTETSWIRSQIIVDLFLDGSNIWAPSLAAQTVSSPWAMDGAVRVAIKSAGMHQLTINDLVSSGTSGPVLGAATSSVHLLSALGELPLKIQAAGANFAAGDSLTFYAPFSETPDSDENWLLLYVDGAHSASRIDSLDASSTGKPLGRQSSYLSTLHLEHDLLWNADPQQASDLLIWKRLVTPNPDATGKFLDATAYLDSPILQGTVTASIHVKGSASYPTVNVLHHLSVEINGSPFSYNEFFLADNDIHTIEMNIPAALFQAGSNTVRLNVLGDLVPPGEYDIVAVDWIDLRYFKSIDAVTNLVEFNFEQSSDQSVLVPGFTTSDIQAYDITDPLTVHELASGQIAANGGGYAIQLAVPTASDSVAPRVLLTTLAALSKPARTEVTSGSDLKNTNQQAQVIYIVPQALSDALAPLIEYRIAHGTSAKLVTVETLYQEFGLGIPSRTAIKNFVTYALSQWAKPAPLAFVLVGSATNDPKNHLGFMSATHKFFAIPTVFDQGLFTNYASDHWYVADAQNSPQAAIARIPVISISELNQYVTKVIDYELGARKPLNSNLSIVTDIDQYGGENFDQRAATLAQNLQTWDSRLATQRINRMGSTVGADQALKGQLTQAFTNGPLVVHYIGHGAENLWGSQTMFEQGDAKALTNTRLPVVIAMNCLTASYTDPDSTSPYYRGLGVNFLLNPRGGAIAVWGSTSLTSPNTQTPYQNAFYEIIAKNPGITLAEATLRAKHQAGVSAGTAEVVGSWTILGDPMIQLREAEGTSTQDTAPSASAIPETAAKSGLACGTIKSINGRKSSGSGSDSSPPNGALELSILGLIFFFATRTRRQER